MDDPQSVEADNDFSTRRMTRSALKRALDPPESDPEQKKLISDQNLGVSKLKPGGLSKKEPGGSSKQKPGGLSRTSENQQQQHHMEMNDDNQHQHLRERKGMTEEGKSLTGQALLDYWRERNKRWRHLTPEEAENYSKKLGESEGFDVIDLPSFIKEYGLIRPVKQSIEEQLVIEKCSKSAIAKYNKEHKKKFRFVKVIMANYKLGSGIFYYITFVAEDKDVGSAKNFQAFVRYQFEKITVQFCRLEKPPNEGGQYNFKYTMKEKDPNMPKKPSPALFWFLEEFTKKYKEKYLTDSAIGHAAGGVWTTMTDTEKVPYEEIARKKMAEYHKDLDAYNKRLEEESYKSTVNDEDEDKEIVEE